MSSESPVSQSEAYPEAEYPDEYVRRSALSHSQIMDDLAGKYGPRVLPGDHPRRMPMCGPPKGDAAIERSKLMADAILLERAVAVLRRRPVAYSEQTVIELGAIALLWRTQAEAPD
jgi:hypothetical protein